jgi:hypothetical protein
MTDDAGERAEASSGASGYTRQSDEIETALSASVSLRTASYLTPGGDLVIGVVRYVRGERKRGLYIPVARARSVADAIAQLAARHGPEPV